MNPTPIERPVHPARHVWVQTASGRQAGLRIAWVRGAEGKWWGKVALSDAPGEASLQLLDASLLSPASTQEQTVTDTKATAPSLVGAVGSSD